MWIRQHLNIVNIFVFVMVFGFAFPGNGDASKKTGKKCSYEIPPVRAAALLSISPDDLVVNILGQMVSPDDIKAKLYTVPPCSYNYRSKTSFLKSISYTVYIYNDLQRMFADYEKMKGNFSTVSKVDAVPGLGDKAFWVGDKRFRRLVAIKGNLLIDVIRPGDLKRKREIVQMVLGE